MSFHIKREDDELLFDTGITGNFVDNARSLGIELEKVDQTVISHGHFDHGGGLPRFMAVNHTSPIFIRQHADEEHLFKAFYLLRKNIGLDKNLFQDYGHRIHLVNDFTEIAPDAYLITQMELKYPTPTGGKYLYMKKGNQLVPDDFRHEQMMVLKDEDSLVIFSGCSHHGVLNMVNAAVNQFPNTPIKALFGGFHFIGLPFMDHMAEKRENVEEVGRKLLDYQVKRVYTGHCTGRKAYPILKKVLKEQLNYFGTGDHVEL